MLGLMQDWPLLLHRIIDHAAKFHGERKVITRSVEGPIVETNYKDIRTRAMKVAQRLEKDGIKFGDRVATLAWNTWRHLETWYGILGIGAIYHTVNPRLFPEQIVWIVNHAEDRAMFVDLTFVPILEKIADRLPTIERYIVLTDAAHMPRTTLKNAVAYEDWIAEVDGDFTWKSFDENTAAGMCYTSGTTGNPKGVLYSHRSNVLHAFMAALPDSKGIASRDVVLPVVPFFHANGWSLAFSTPMVGRHAGAAGTKARRRLDLRAAQHLQGHLHRRGADGVADAAAGPREDRRQTAAPEARGDRRLGLPARHDQDLRRQIRRRGGARLGHDRDEPARLALHHETGTRGADRRGEARRADEAGPSAVRRGDEDHRRRRQGPAVGRQDLRPPEGARALRSPRATTRAKAAKYSRRTAGSTPATSPPWTATATCRSPTAPRT